MGKLELIKTKLASLLIEVKFESIKTDKAILAQRKKKFGMYYKAPKFFRAWAWFLRRFLRYFGRISSRVQ